MTPPTPVALVTGGSRRIGAAICRSLHHAGFNLVIHYRSSGDSARQLAQTLNHIRGDSARTFSADLDDMQQLKALADFTYRAWGRVDTLVNNASTFFATPLQEATEAQWDALLNSNLKAPFFLSQQLSASLAEHNGNIINIADIFAERPMPNHCIYSIAKAGNRMLTQALALELAPSVRVNGIAPGAMLWPENADGEEQQDPKKLELIPLRRLGGAQAIADTALFLASAAYITGEIIKVDGGRSLKQ